MASEIYGAGIEAIVSGDVSWKSGDTTLKAKLCLSGLAYDDADLTLADITAGDVPGATDITLTPADPDSGTPAKILLKASEGTLTFTAVTEGSTVGSVVVYDDTADTLLCFLDIDATVTNGGSIEVTVPSAVYMELTY